MSDFSLENKVCVITGAGKGIGREIAKLFYENGAKIALITRDENDFVSLKQELAYNETRVLTFVGDVSKEDNVVDFIKAVIDKFAIIDVLINNAGMRFRKDFLEISSDEWSKVMDTNVGSVYLFCREVGRHMVAGKQGKIINIASIAGTLGLPQLSVYAASKGAMISFTKCLALEWAEKGINVNAIAPGFCETSYADNFKKKKDLYDFTIERIPQKKWGSSRDVANACLFLATDASNYITGEVLTIDGGWSAW